MVAPAVEAGPVKRGVTAPVPVIDSVSPSASAVAPKAVTISITARRRSTSLTRNSPTSEKTVVPSATAAATASAGISSSEGISAAVTVGGHQPGPPTSVVAPMVAVPSGADVTVTAAPIRWRTETYPSRAGPW